jgi:serine/threonine protein kinase
MALNLLPSEHRLALPAGFQLDRYRILRVLGNGGFGITYLAEVRPYPQVAIKELFPKDFATRADGHRVIPHGPSGEEKLAWAKQRFLDEAKILEHLHHPNIVPVQRYFELLDTAYLVMKFIPGQHLDQWIKTRPKPTEQELAGILLPLLDGLEYIHQQEFLHRDVSPENVIVTPEGQPILVDFGSARKAISGRTLTTVVRPGYSPIEQYQKVTPQGPFTDIYALAGIMVHAITRKEPPQAVDRAGARDTFTPLAARFRNKYSKRFLEGIDAGFAVSPERRPQNVAAWRRMFPKPEPPKVPRERVRPTPESKSRPVVQPALKPVKPDEQRTIEKKPKLSHAKKSQNLIWLAGIPLGAGAVISLLLLIPKQTVLPTSPTPSPGPTATVVSSTTTTPQTATIQHPFVNSLGMRFVPVNVGDNIVLFCIHQTRRSDYQSVIGEPPKPVSYGLAPSDITADAPVVDVTQREASQFCEQLSQREARDWTYRLPTRDEWDRAFGDRHIPWPPKNNDTPMGNYLDSTGENFLHTSNSHDNSLGDLTPIPGYDDNFATTAPVMHFQNQNAFGLYDMGSNVDEWCSDTEYTKEGSPCNFYKGASWIDSDRNVIQKPTTVHKEYRDSRFDYVGFRCVLEVKR